MPAFSLCDDPLFNITVREICMRFSHTKKKALNRVTLVLFEKKQDSEESPMKVAKRVVRKSTHSIPSLRFEEQALTSFAGLPLFQILANALDLKGRLRACTRHCGSSSSYGLGTILYLLLIHLLLGWKKLRDIDFYRHDPLVLRVVGLTRLPSVAAVSRSLRALDAGVVRKLRDLLRNLVVARLIASTPRRITLDFDGTVRSTKSRCTEGTAVGYNTKAKGQRSYYPLVATVAQTGQFFDFLHRPGNVHDSKGARAFVIECVRNLREAGFSGLIESRMDSAHFNEDMCRWLNEVGIEFSVSVPFERFPKLKGVVECRKRWHRVDRTWSYFEMDWNPEKWKSVHFRVLVFRQSKRIPRKGPIQLDLFEPVDRHYEYKVVMTNKDSKAAGILPFHNGRGGQEAIFGEAKTGAGMDYLPTRHLVGNQTYQILSMLAHNLTREIQIRTTPKSRVFSATRACLWVIDRIGSFRRKMLLRAGRLTRPEGQLTLTISANKKQAREIERLHDALLAA